ncbi:MAG TPA: FecR domain-containing protein [Flavitalea sp.]|nr:FecR domain-containing protein [Flavitalea sp.]
MIFQYVELLFMDAKSYEDFELEDLIANESFLNYHLGKTCEDQIFWEEWIAKHPAKADLVEAARGMINAFMFRLDDAVYQEELQKLKAKTAPGNSRINRKQSLIRFPYKHDEKGKVSRIIVGRYLIIPVLVIVALGAYLYFNSVTGKVQTAIISENSGLEPMTLILSDSTKVVLTSGSRLEYQRQFDDKERNVSLVGEGFFQVTKDASRPFRVLSKGLTATVLGTEFNVKSTFGDSLVLVELISGRVKVEAENVTGAIVLNPNERAVYARSKGNIYKEKWNKALPAAAIKISYLAFDKDSFEEVARKMNEAFGITLINNSSNIKWSFTGEFSDISARDIIENICLLKHLSYEIKGDTIVLR